MRNFRRVPRKVKRCGSLLGETEYLRAMMFLAQVPTRAEDEALSAWEVQLPLQWDKGLAASVAMAEIDAHMLLDLRGDDARVKGDSHGDWVG